MDLSEVLLARCRQFTSETPTVTAIQTNTAIVLVRAAWGATTANLYMLLDFHVPQVVETRSERRQPRQIRQTGQLPRPRSPE